MRNNVRITSGLYRGREILTPGGSTHPMGEREKLALFNMITPYLSNAKVLDAYAGSGALGIEALSRGASFVDFVECSSEAAKIIKQNLAKLEISENITIYKQKVTDFKTAEPYDIIIADPPYDIFKLDEIKHLTEFLWDGGILVLSHPDTVAELAGLELLKSRQYARAHISIFKKQS